jgi:hypothetical protein
MRLAEETTDEARTRCTRGGLTRRQRTGAHMLNGNARDDRPPIGGGVDFTLMYASHDAFTRDLQRLAAAAGAGQTADPAVKAGWAMFTKQLWAPKYRRIPVGRSRQLLRSSGSDSVPAQVRGGRVWSTCR